MTNPNWKPQPGKPAMTRDGKTLVTDLAYDPRHTYFPLYSKALDYSWRDTGRLMLGDRPHDDDLIEPDITILAAHGIDADGKPIVTGDCSIPGSPHNLASKIAADVMKNTHLSRLLGWQADEVHGHVQETVLNALLPDKASEVVGPSAYVAEFRKSDGVYDYYVMLKCADREMSIQLHHIKGRAEYGAAEINHILTGSPKPDFRDYDTEGTST